MTRDSLSVVGKSVHRSDAVDKVTGKARFGADRSVSGMLWAAVVRSQRPHAELLSVDVSMAKKLSGVEAVVTAKDIPGNNVVPVVFRDQPSWLPKKFGMLVNPSHWSRRLHQKSLRKPLAKYTLPIKIFPLYSILWKPENHKR